jgi:hypothetical protein
MKRAVSPVLHQEVQVCGQDLKCHNYVAFQENHLVCWRMGTNSQASNHSFE